MEISEIAIHGVTVHRDLRLALPPRGIVLVTGPNGAGKSSIVEGVALALWGKGIRGGASLWAGGVKDAHAEVVADGRRVRRTEAGTVKLAWEGGAEYQTTTKAQEALTAEIGERERWRRCSVLSATDAATFAGATDTARKVLLESFAGIEDLTLAYPVARAAKDGAVAEQAKVQRDRAAAVARLEVAQAAVEALPAEASPEPPDIVAPPPGTLSRLQGCLDGVEKDIAENTREQTAAQAERRYLGELKKTADRHAALVDAGRCFTCGHVMGEDERAAVLEKAQGAQEAHDQGARLLARRLHALETDAVSLASEREALGGLLREAMAREREAEHARVAREAWQERAARRAQAESAAQGFAAALTEVDAALGEASREVQEHEAAAAVLGPRGLRARLLSSTGRALEGRTNDWLGRLSGDRLAVRLRSTTPTKSGKDRDVVLFEVGKRTAEGYQFLPYLSRSAGERRRVDVALGFGLREVADGRGSRGTLFADEIFDSLDDSGRETVVEGLVDLARDRCVVVISHTADFVRPYAAQHWHIEDGALVAR